MSKNDTGPYVQQKVEDYLAAGVKVVWVAEPTKRTITAHQAGREPATYGEDDVLSVEEIMHRACAQKMRTDMGNGERLALRQRRELLYCDARGGWHVWDGRQDGFHALVNYHALDNATLKKLTYSYLGDWIRQQGEDAKADKPGAAERLGSARSLQTNLGAILKGEAPLDIFVRWKSLEEQALGWQPDLNDGICQNIRPFLLVGDVAKKAAGVFRTIPLKLKDKDRGIEPSRPKDEYPWFWCEQEPGTDPGGGAEFAGNRWNNCHLTLATKEAARKR